MKLVAAVAILFCAIQYNEAAFTKCDRSYHKVGCFKEKQTNMDLLITDRDSSSSKYQGHMLNWGKFLQSIHSLACRCSVKAKQMGYTYFSIRFWAECWAGKDSSQLEKLLKNPNAQSNKCASHTFGACDINSKEECVGKASHDYIYSLAQKAEESKDGGYTAWSTWTSCSKSCGAGTQERERSCTNPEPLGKGADCEKLGAATESRSCKVKECPVDGKLSAWGAYGSCSKSCGQGTQKRTRTCTPPKHGGKACNGALEQSKSCKVKECPVGGCVSSHSSGTCKTIGGECWCYKPSGTKGSQVCGYASNYQGKYYSLAKDTNNKPFAIIQGLGQKRHSSHCKSDNYNGCKADCATNQCTSQGCWGTALSCWNNKDRWARTHGGIVRCVNKE